MSTSAQVEAAWEAAIWEHDTVLSYTDKIHLYSITQDSEKEIQSLYFNKQINFIQATTGRGVRKGETGRVNYDYTVTVSYILYKDPQRDNWTTIRDFFDALYPLVVSELGNRWTNTVDFWEPQEGPAVISEITIDNKTAWEGTFRFLGYKHA